MEGARSITKKRQVDELPEASRTIEKAQRKKDNTFRKGWQAICVGIRGKGKVKVVLKKLGYTLEALEWNDWYSHYTDTRDISQGLIENGYYDAYGSIQ